MNHVHHKRLQILKLQIEISDTEEAESTLELLASNNSRCKEDTRQYLAISSKLENGKFHEALGLIDALLVEAASVKPNCSSLGSACPAPPANAPQEQAYTLGMFLTKSGKARLPTPAERVSAESIAKPKRLPTPAERASAESIAKPKRVLAPK